MWHLSLLKCQNDLNWLSSDQLDLVPQSNWLPEEMWRNKYMLPSTIFHNVHSLSACFLDALASIYSYWPNCPIKTNDLIDGTIKPLNVIRPFMYHPRTNVNSKWMASMLISWIEHLLFNLNDLIVRNHHTYKWEELVILSTKISSEARQV